MEELRGILMFTKPIKETLKETKNDGIDYTKYLIAFRFLTSVRHVLAPQTYKKGESFNHDDLVTNGPVNAVISAINNAMRIVPQK